MTPQEMETRIVRYGDLRPCKTAFIDAHTPGVRPEGELHHHRRRRQRKRRPHVHIVDTPGFNIGAAGQPPAAATACTVTARAEVVLCPERPLAVLLGPLGDGRRGEPGGSDIFNIPTGIFRAFENVGTDYG